LNQRDDFIGTYTVLTWEPGDGLPGDLLAVGQALAVSGDGDFGCQLVWNDATGQPRSLSLRWTPLFGGALYQSFVEVKGAAFLLAEAGVALQAAPRQLAGALRGTEVTGDPGTFAAQATLPPAGYRG
jgi:hypothetical protein